MNYRTLQQKFKRDFWPSLDRLEYILVLIMLVLIPVMLQNLYSSPFRSEWLKKLQPVDLLFILVLVVWLARTTRNPARLLSVPLKLPLMLYVATTAVSLISAKDLALGILEVSIKIYLAMAYVVIASVITTERRFFQALRVWLIAAVVIVVIGLVGYAVALYTSQENFLVYAGRNMPFFGRCFRLKSTLQPTSKLLSTYLLIGVPMAFIYLRFFTRKRLEQIIIGMGLIFMLIADFLTISRGIVPLFLCAGIILFRHWNPWLVRRVLAITLVMISLVGMLGIFFVSTIRILSIEAKHSTDSSKQAFDRHYYSSDPTKGLETVSLSINYAYDNYFWLKRAALYMFAENPLIGVGAGNFGVSLRQLKDKGCLPEKLPEFVTAQSEPFDRLAETGLLGFLSCLYLFGSVLIILLRKLSSISQVESTIAWSSLAALIGLAFVCIDLDISNFRFVWAFLGIIFGFFVSGASE